MVAMHNPPAQWLRTFLGVAHSGSFSEAADRLHMTQAAVSKHIRQLEHSYGVSLFVRHARGVELSEAGNQLYPKVHQAFELLTQAGDALQLDRQRQRVRLRCDATWAEAVLAPKLADFANCHPHIQLQLSTYIWLDEIPRGHFDLHIALAKPCGTNGRNSVRERSMGRAQSAIPPLCANEQRLQATACQSRGTRSFNTNSTMVNW